MTCVKARSGGVCLCVCMVVIGLGDRLAVRGLPAGSLHAGGAAARHRSSCPAPFTSWSYTSCSTSCTVKAARGGGRGSHLVVLGEGCEGQWRVRGSHLVHGEGCQGQWQWQGGRLGHRPQPRQPPQELCPSGSRGWASVRHPGAWPACIHCPGLCRRRAASCGAAAHTAPELGLQCWCRDERSPEV